MSKFDPGRIQIDGSQQYESDVETQLKAILRNPVGKLLLELIDAESKKHIRIVPYTGGDCNASTRPANPSDAAPPRPGGKLYAGNPDSAYFDPKKGKLVPTTRDDLATYTGTGKGSDTTVNYSPNTYVKSACFGGLYGSQPDEALFHELVHGYRHLRGMNNPIPTHEKLYGYWNEEEWLAILIANIFISAKNGHNKNLRKDHASHEELKAPLNTSDGFLRDYSQLRLVEKYVGQELWWFEKLKGISAPYNPIAEFMLNFPKYSRR